MRAITKFVNLVVIKINKESFQFQNDVVRLSGVEVLV
jgi:hypothetical protein